MGKKKEGFCHICGEYVELTFEHIPPKQSGNCSQVNEISGDVLMACFADIERLPWDLKGLKYKQKQKGMGKYTLCQRCNNNTGSWYGEDYVIFSNTMAALLAKERPQPNMGVSFTIEMRPLNFIKQVLSLFCSINKYPLNTNISEFILQKESNEFINDEYILSMFLYIGSIQKLFGTSILCSFPDKDNDKFKTISVSEICNYPLGFCLYKRNKDLKDIIGTDITYFSNYSVDEYSEVNISLPVLTSNSILPQDYRLKNQFNVQ